MYLGVVLYCYHSISASARRTETATPVDLCQPLALLQQHNPVTKDKVKVTKTDLNPQNILPKDTGIHYVDSKAYAFS